MGLQAFKLVQTHTNCHVRNIKALSHHYSPDLGERYHNLISNEKIMQILMIE